jgi:AraC family transcriptional regulator
MHQLRAIQRALDLIEAGLREPLRLEALARRVGMSRWHFQRTFAAMVGETAGSYLRRRRIAEAALALRARERRILDVALEYQFESHEAFTRAFQAELKLAPSAWRAGRPATGTGLARIFVTSEILNQRYGHMKLTPEIVTLPARTFVGLEARFQPPHSPGANNLKVIPKLWDDFIARIQEAGSIEPWVSYGLSECPADRGLKATQPDEQMYLAAVAAKDGAVPPAGMVAWKSPAGTYAKFIHRGQIGKIGETFGFIYGQWLRSGKYDRAKGPDLERMDGRFEPMSDESVLEIFVPVKARK